MEYYWNKEHTKIGVLVSVGFGAGWSTWNDPNLSFDRRIIEWWREHPNAPETVVKNFLNSIGYEDVYTGGYDNLKLVWVPKCSFWRINEYDGAESLEIFDPNNWNYFKE